MLQGIIRLIFAPYFNIKNLIATFNSSRVLSRFRDWKYYPHFCDHGMLVAPFYWVRIANIMRHGRSGISDTLGLGNHSMRSFWQYSIPSIYLYWKAGAVVLILSGVALILSHFLWLGQVDAFYIYFLVGIMLSSDKYFAQVFCSQNYNIVGWLFVPYLLYALSAGSYVLALLLLIALALSSVTALFLSSLFVIAFSLWTLQFQLILLPGFAFIVFTIFSFYPFSSSMFSEVLNRFKLIGLVKGRTVKYKLTKREITVKDTIDYMLQIQFVSVAFIVGDEIFYLCILTITLMLFNHYACRFADDQTFNIAFMITAAYHMISTVEFNFIVILSYFYSLYTPSFRSYPLRPINVKYLLGSLIKFLKPVDNCSTVFMAFKNPNGLFDNIFDGYRFLVDYIVYCGDMKSVHILPDYSTIYELNNFDSPDYWGTNVSEVISNMNKLKTRYVIIYQDTGSKLCQKWLESGFRQLSEFDWGEVLLRFPYYVSEYYGRPKLFLLEKSN